MASKSNISYGNYSVGEPRTTDCVDEEGKIGVMMVKSLAYCIVIVLSLIGNGLVIRIFYKNRSFKTTTNCFIVNMAASDIMLPIFVIPRHVLAVFEEGPYGLHAWHVSGFIGELLCKLIPFIGDVSNSVSIFTLVLISCDRYFAIVWPLSYKLHITAKKCNVLIAITWAISFIIHSPYFYTFKLYYLENKTLCIAFWSSVDKVGDATHEQRSRESQKTYFLFLLIVVYLVPLTLITFLYSSIIRELRVSIRNHSSQQRRQRRREDNRVIAMLVIIVTIFAVFFAPIHMLVFLQSFILKPAPQTACTMKTIQFSFFFLTLSTCCVNPYIYFIFIRKYRHGAKTLLKDIFTSRVMTVCPVTRASKCCVQDCLDDLDEGLQENNNVRRRNSSSCRVRQTENILLASEHEQTFQFETGV